MPRPPAAARARGRARRPERERGRAGGSGSACGSAAAGSSGRGLVSDTETGSARNLSLLEPLEAERDRLAREVARRARHLDERELERQARVAALTHVVDRDREQVDEPQDRGLLELIRLRLQPLPRFLARRGRLGHVAEVLREHDLPQVLEQVEYEPAEVVSALRELLQVRERAGGVAVDHEVAEAEERLLLDRAEQLEHGLHRDLVAGRRSELVERRDRVAVRAASAAGDERERLVGRVDSLGVRNLAQHLDEVLQARPLEDERLAARANGRQHLREVGRAEDEDEVRRRLLDQLQERVPRRVGELVRLVEDVDLVAPLDRLEDDAVADLADVVDAALRGGVHLDHVERRAGGDRAARVTRAVGRRRRPLRAVEALGEDARHRGLAGAARAGEEVGLAHRVGRDRVAQRPDDRLLPDDVLEGLWTVFPVERSHGTIQAENGVRGFGGVAAPDMCGRGHNRVRQHASGEAARTERAESGAGEAGKRTRHTAHLRGTT